MKILIIDSGARGHAIGASLKRSDPKRELFFARGNAGTATIGENLNISDTDIPTLRTFAKQAKIDLTLPLTETILFANIVGAFQEEDLRIFGPTSAAAQIESSKAWADEISRKARIPIPRSMSFSDYGEARRYVEAINGPYYIKASGPALGKGAIPCLTSGEAVEALNTMMLDGKFGDAGKTVVIQEYLEGSEYSFHAFCDKTSTIILPVVRDHKRALDGDLGGNTGGMGTVIVSVSPTFLNDIKVDVIERLLEAMEERGVPFRGLLFPGIMNTKRGFKVLEFNARPGDPETEVLMTLLKSDLLEPINGSIDDSLDKVDMEWHPGGAACVIMASGGYPGNYGKGFPITGIEDAEKIQGVSVYHAGTAMKDGVLVTNGGRVLAVTARAESTETALSLAYKAVDCIHFKGMHFRRDIGHSVLKEAFEATKRR